MTFITLTDGAGNCPRGKLVGQTIGSWSDEEYGKENVYQIGKSKFVGGYHDTTEKLLSHIGKTYDVNIIGFYIIKRVKRWNIEKYINDYKDYNDKQNQYNKMRKDFTTR